MSRGSFDISLVHHSECRIFFPNDSNLNLNAYYDADRARCLDTRSSTTGWCVYLGNTLIPWKCQQQDHISKSSKRLNIIPCHPHVLRSYGYSFYSSCLVFLKKQLLSSRWQQECNTKCYKFCVSQADEAHRCQFSLNPRSIWWPDHYTSSRYYRSTSCRHLHQGPSCVKQQFFVSKLIVVDSPTSI